MSYYFTGSVIAILLVISKDIFKLYLRSIWSFVRWSLIHAGILASNTTDANLMARIVALETRLKKQEADIHKFIGHAWSLRKHTRDSVDNAKKEMEQMVLSFLAEQRSTEKNSLEAPPSPPRRTATFEVSGSP